MKPILYLAIFFIAFTSVIGPLQTPYSACNLNTYTLMQDSLPLSGGYRGVLIKQKDHLRFCITAQDGATTLLWNSTGCKVADGTVTAISQTKIVIDFAQATSGDCAGASARWKYVIIDLPLPHISVQYLPIVSK